MSQHEAMSRVLVGDCREVMATLDAASVDAVVTDPPYGLEFMGKDWDRPWAVNASNAVGYAGRDDLRLPSHRDNRNANCRTCGGRQRGANRCKCETPNWDRDPRSDMQAFQDWSETWAREALRVLKPGGHLLAFGGARTFHRMTVAIEDAGFEIKDCLSWLHGQGFPKHKSLLKPGYEPVVMAQKTADTWYNLRSLVPIVEAELCRVDSFAKTDTHLSEMMRVNGYWSIGPSLRQCLAVISNHTNTFTIEIANALTTDLKILKSCLSEITPASITQDQTPSGGVASSALRAVAISISVLAKCERRESTTAGENATESPAIPAIGQAASLRPNWEPIILARKRGAGLLNIDACRIESDVSTVRYNRVDIGFGGGLKAAGIGYTTGSDKGRWPANVCLDETAAALLDEQSGERGGGFATRGASSRIYGGGKGFTENTGETVGYGDTGGASRFFFVARNEVQYDLNSQAERGDDWADQDHRQSIQADSATPPQRAITASTSGTRLPEKDAPSWPTSSNGSGITARSLTATRSITETATSKTTPSPTSNSLTPSRTSDCIPAANCEPERGGSHAAPVASSSQSTPSIGISALKDGRSTDDAAPAISARSLPISKGGVRFAYVPKASRRERNLGLPGGESSNHPTVKPIALMRWLVRLVTPPDGLVLDPFTGSGSTGVACAHEGFRFLGIEQSDEYAEIARRRIAAVNPLFALAAD